MRLLLTLNMPSAQGFLVHQITIEHTCNTLDEFCDEMNDNEFIVGRLLYRIKTPTGDTAWRDRGDIILNTSHIGKAQEFLYDEREEYDEPFGNTEQRRGYADGKRPPLRTRGPMF